MGARRIKMTNQKVVRELLRLEQDNGHLDPNDVIEAAKSPGSPLHSYFEWDDSTAAAKYRLDQARALIRSVKIEVTIHDVPLSCVGYVRDPEADADIAGYRNVVKLRSEEDAARAVIMDEMKRVSAAISRAKAVAAVLGMADDVAKIDDAVRSFSGRMIDATSSASV